MLENGANTTNILTSLLNTAIQNAFPSISYRGKVIPTDSKFGDYESSDAIAILHILKSQLQSVKSSREVGVQIVNHFPPNEIIGHVPEWIY
jgi:hypothetical protein